MTSNRARAIAALKGHGQPPMSTTLRTNIIDLLAAAGLLADDLPAPSFYAYENQDKPMWDTCNHFRADALESPRVVLSKAGNVWKMTPDEARDLALALLAASDHAQKGETNE